jgi:hypothetical protein
MSAKYIAAVDFRPNKNVDQVSTYRWNDKVADNLFCKTCGIFPYFGNEEWGYRINLGCVEQIDALSLNISIIDGKSMAVAEDPGPWPGSEHP